MTLKRVALFSVNFFCELDIFQMQRGCWCLCCFSSLCMFAFSLAFPEENEYFTSDLSSICLLLKHHLPFQEALRALPQFPLEVLSYQPESSSCVLQSNMAKILGILIKSASLTCASDAGGAASPLRKVSDCKQPFRSLVSAGSLSVGPVHSAVCSPSSRSLPSDAGRHTHSPVPPGRAPAPLALL